MDGKTAIKKLISDVILIGGSRIEEAVELGPEALLAQIDDLVSVLGSIRVVITLTSGPIPDCGNPDCPVHGTAVRNPNTN